MQMSGEIIRKYDESKKFCDTMAKPYWYRLIGSEFYSYKTNTDEKHKKMSSLRGVFIKDEPAENFDKNTVFYPFKLIFPHDGTKKFYCKTKTEKR